jgi:hypothetical protein
LAGGIGGGNTGMRAIEAISLQDCNSIVPPDLNGREEGGKGKGVEPPTDGSAKPSAASSSRERSALL